MSDLIEKTDDTFPPHLRLCPGCPDKLLYKGDLRVFSKRYFIAIVGTRTPTPYGKKIAYDFAFFLARKGVVIVSGLARGIDTVAHEAALAAEGSTIAVLGSGLSHIYPPENEKLFKKIQDKGCVISEYEDSVKPSQQAFLDRNRIIAGISQKTLVVEGRRRSGTLSTASYAATYGREVYAIPGRLTDPFSEAPNFLISEGSRIAFSPMELLENK